MGNEGRISPWGHLNRQLPFVILYLEHYWPRAGKLSVTNAIGTQLRDPTEIEKTSPMAHDGFGGNRDRRKLNPVGNRQTFSLGVKNERVETRLPGLIRVPNFHARINGDRETSTSLFS